MLLSTCGFAWLIRDRNLSDQSVIVLKLGHSLDPSHPVHEAMQFMAQRLAEKSGGQVRLEIFPNGQLGSETECLEQLQRGALAMTKTSAAPMESFIPEMAIFGIPYLFQSPEHFWRFAESPDGRQLLLKGESVGLRGLCYYDAGARSFYTIGQPILKPDDLSGLKIRVQQSKTAMDMVEALGGSPTPIAWGELYTALQQKMVDGAENNPPSFFSNRHFEVCKHLSLDEHAMVPDMLLISQSVWQDLPPHVQQAVQESADESCLFQRQLWESKSREVLEAIQREGVTVHYPDKQPFVSQVARLHADFQASALGGLMQVIDDLK
ncbi:MAG: TRAP transporter substrate-binding protein [bacterium]|nr:TRAP transporter substrate-binding protein [bacterium]